MSRSQQQQVRDYFVFSEFLNKLVKLDERLFVESLKIIENDQYDQFWKKIQMIYKVVHNKVLEDLSMEEIKRRIKHLKKTHVSPISQCPIPHDPYKDYRALNEQIEGFLKAPFEKKDF